VIKMISNKETIAQLAKEGKRIDGRGLMDYRQPIQLETNISWTAEGSAKVQIGETVVMAGVKLAIEKPYNDTSDQGGIMINAELLPLSSPEYESGPPGIKAIELARVTDRGIREAKAIDMKKLCITPGEKAWFVIIDINGQLIVDPTTQEEHSYDARLTVASDEKGTISALQKGGELPLTIEEVGKMVDIALEKAKFLRAEVDKVVK
jgi:exosome complex RNA-binding protein Rrp42 (RNase PH superfamily)